MTRKLSRRELGLSALGAAALAQAQTGETATYSGALDGVETKLQPESFDPVAWSRMRYESAPLRLTFSASNRRQAEAWQKRLRTKLTELLGGFPSQHTALQPETLEVREFPTYRREKLVFESRPGLAVLVYLLTPRDGGGPHPAVICVPGHGRGVDDIVGIDDRGRDRTDKSGYQHDFALQVVEHGLAAVAIEPLAFGCRRDPRARSRGLGVSSCQPSAGAALLLGETMIGWRAYDVMRTIDWIESRPELNSKRIGCMGISGGGTCTLFTAAVEPRIRAALVSGYLNTFRDSILSISHCIDNYVPGILQWAEMYDVAGLIAPRPLFIESGEKDGIFPIEATRASFEKVRRVYDVFGAGDATELEVFPDGHSFHGVRGLPFLDRRLKS
ncbi:MAG: alpha/beta hydrolase family protein [Bryobacteraceae bacterium]